jgi:hypothetical protein
MVRRFSGEKAFPLAWQGCLSEFKPSDPVSEDEILARKSFFEMLCNFPGGCTGTHNPIY